MIRSASLRRSSTLPAALLLPAVTLVVTWAGSSTASTGHTVEIRGLSFIPEEIAINPGDTVTWTNFDDDRHKLKGGRMNGPEMKMGDRFSFRFDHPGKVAYTCTVHTYMRGTVTIGGGAGGAHGEGGAPAPEAPAPTTTTTEGSHLVPIVPVRGLNR